LSGCNHFRIETASQVDVVSPVRNEVSMEMYPGTLPGRAGPLIEMCLPGYGSGHGRAKIAVLDVDGLLLNQNLSIPGPWGTGLVGENPLALFHEKLQAIQADPCVGAVLLRINSPGGGVSTTDMMWQELQRYRHTTGKPVVACLMDVAAGGGYYLATAADYIVAHPTTITGGIGVIWNSYNLKDTMAQVNIIPQPIKSGELIDMGSTSKFLTGDAKRILQQMADEFHQRFKDVVLTARPKTASAGPGVFDGQVYTAQQALRYGLIDEIGYLEQAIGMAQRLAHQDGASVVMYRRKTDAAYSAYAISLTQGTPPASPLVMSLPGLERSRLPAFLYLWQPEPTLDR
jgi:protease-4